jgi:hypothetical protein
VFGLDSRWAKVNPIVVFGGGVIPKNREDGVVHASSHFDLKPNTSYDNFSRWLARLPVPPRSASFLSWVTTTRHASYYPTVEKWTPSKPAG